MQTNNIVVDNKVMIRVKSTTPFLDTLHFGKLLIPWTPCRHNVKNKTIRKQNHLTCKLIEKKSYVLPRKNLNIFFLSKIYNEYFHISWNLLKRTPKNSEHFLELSTFWRVFYRKVSKYRTILRYFNFCFSLLLT